MAEEMGGSSGENLSNCVDDSYYSALLVVDDEGLLPSGEKQTPLLDAGEEISAVSDETYAEALQLQEVLMSSAAAATAAAPPPPDSSQPPPPQSGCDRLTAASARPETAIMAGEPSFKGTFCDICFEAKSLQEMFTIPNCGHIFCKDCVCRHISVCVQGKIAAVKCLAEECGGTLEPEQCREIVPRDVFDRWGAAVCEAMLLGCPMFYCPFKDCSAPMLQDGEEKVRASECPHCHRLFCAQCGVPWHAGLECEEFQNLGADERGGHDLMLLDLAKNKNWKRCPTCRFYVERGEGCLHMTCRCGVQFCYGCGSPWSDVHASCHT